MDGQGAQSAGLLARAARVVVPWVALVVIAVVVWSWLGDYRDARTGANDGGEATGTVTPTGTPAGDDTEQTPSAPPTGDDQAASGYVTVLAEGLNLRTEPMTSSTVIKKLGAGERLTLIEEGAGWYRVRDATGAEGWVAAGPSYTELVK